MSVEVSFYRYLTSTMKGSLSDIQEAETQMLDVIVNFQNMFLKQLLATISLCSSEAWPCDLPGWTTIKCMGAF